MKSLTQIGRKRHQSIAGYYSRWWQVGAGSLQWCVCMYYYGEYYDRIVRSGSVQNDNDYILYKFENYCSTVLLR